MIGKKHDPWAVRFAAAHTPTGGEFLPWPTRVPPVAMVVPASLDVRAWKRPFDLVLFPWAALGMVASPWLLLVSPLRIKLAGALLTALCALALLVVGSARFQADETGLVLSQPLSRLKLAWSDVAAVSCPEPRRVYRRQQQRQLYAIRVELVRHDGTIVAPFVLQRRVRLDWIRGAEAAVADWVVLDALWRRYSGPPAVAPWLAGREVSISDTSAERTTIWS